MGNVKRAFTWGLAALAAALVFGLLMFPYGDLSGLLSKYALEQGNVWIQSDDLSLSLFPSPGVSATGVTIEPVDGSPLKKLEIGSLTVRPLLSALLAFKQGLVVSGTGLFGGEFHVAATLGAPPKELQNGYGQLSFSKFDFSELSLAAALSSLGGSPQGTKLNGEFRGKFSASSPRFTVDLVAPGGGGPSPANPEGEASLSVTDLGPVTTVPLGSFGDLDIPPLKISKTSVNVAVKKSRAQITRSAIGSDQDPVKGRVLGDVGLAFSPAGVSFGSYVYCLELTISDAYLESARKQFGNSFALIEQALNQYKRNNATGPGFHIGIKASGADFQRLLRNELMTNELPQKGDCTGLTAPGA